MVFAHEANPLKALVYMLRQDDPSKCTAAKLVRFGLAQPAKLVRRNTIVLNPFSERPVMKSDARVADSTCAIDCSWERAAEVLRMERLIARGIARRLPALLAANPVNYAKLGKMSSAEALAASLYILGFRGMAGQIMDKFKWGHTFLELNSEPLLEYAETESLDDLLRIEREYFPQLD
jgi:pre-rRNA-processing protein TSR3